MKILIGYDGSADADAAVREVLRRTWPAGSEVRLVTAVPAVMVPPVAGGVQYYAPLWERSHAETRELARQRLLRVQESFAGRPDLATSIEVREEDPKTALLAAAREWPADLLVLGSQGTSAFGRMFIGSVCHAMVSHAPCSVEVVRALRAA